MNKGETACLLAYVLCFKLIIFLFILQIASLPPYLSLTTNKTPTRSQATPTIIDIVLTIIIIPIS